jgi:hypothetical protein
MKITGKETVTRYEVEFDASEAEGLKRAGHLPPWASDPPRARLTADEIQHIALEAKAAGCVIRVPDEIVSEFVADLIVGGN